MKRYIWLIVIVIVFSIAIIYLDSIKRDIFKSNSYTEEDINQINSCDKYLSTYIYLLKDNNYEEAFEMLSEKKQEAFSNSLEKFKMYVTELMYGVNKAYDGIGWYVKKEYEKDNMKYYEYNVISYMHKSLVGDKVEFFDDKMIYEPIIVIEKYPFVYEIEF